MSADPSQTQPADAEANIPIPPGINLQPRAERAARRIHKALGVYPWDIVPESPPKGWAINLVEDLALVTEHVARSADATLEDLREELRKSIARDRKPSYAGRLMAQDIQAAKKRFVRGHRDSTSREQSGGKPGQPERRGLANIPPAPSESREAENTIEGNDEDDPSSITVASGAPDSPPLPRNVKTLKRSAPPISTSPEKRGRASSPDGSRLSAAQSLMLFSSPMASFTMSNPTRSSNTPLRSSSTLPLPLKGFHEPLRSATMTFLSAIDSHIQSIRVSFASAQQEVFSHRSVHQDSVRQHRVCEAHVAHVEQELADARDQQRKLVEETAEQDALAPQLRALEENNMSLPPEIAQAIRNYESQRAVKNGEIRKQEAAIDSKAAELEQAKKKLRVAEEESNRLDAGIQDLQLKVSHGSEAARLAELYGLMVRLGPDGLASIERIYPEIGSLLQTLLATDGHSSMTMSTEDESGVDVDPSLR